MYLRHRRFHCLLQGRPAIFLHDVAEALQTLSKPHELTSRLVDSIFLPCLLFDASHPNDQSGAQGGKSKDLSRASECRAVRDLAYPTFNQHRLPVEQTRYVTSSSPPDYDDTGYTVPCIDRGATERGGLLRIGSSLTLTDSF